MAYSNNFVTILLLLLPYIATTSAAAGPTSTLFILTSCSKTTYPTLCFTSLATHASAIQTSPELLANTSLSVTHNDTQSTSTLVTKLSQINITSITNPRVASAMLDCVELLSDSVDQVNESIARISQLKGPDFDFALSDIQTYLSAAITNEVTCTDGLSEATGNSMAGNLMMAPVVRVSHMTSNALALVNQYAANLTINTTIERT